MSMQGSPAWTSSVPLNDVIAQTAAADTPLAARFTPAQPRHTRLQTDQRRRGMSSGAPAARASAFCLRAACLSKQLLQAGPLWTRQQRCASSRLCTPNEEKAGGDIYGLIGLSATTRVGYGATCRSVSQDAYKGVDSQVFSRV